MRTSLIWAAVVAVASSLLTFGTVELIRGSRASASSSRPGTSQAPAPRTGPGADPLASPASEPRDGSDDRLEELESRIAALELGARSSRSRVTPSSTETGASGLPEAEEDLRALVLEWMAEEREVRTQVQAVRAEETRRQQQEFSARYQAYMLAQQHDLADWEEERLVDVFLATRIREAEVQKQVQGLTDPAEVEAQWVAFDEWVDQLEREGMGQELWDKLATDE